MDLTKTADTTTGNSPFTALSAMVYEPSKAFIMLQPKRHAWLPLVLVMLSSLIVVQWYFSVVDFAWFIDAATAGIKDPGVRERASHSMGKGMMQIMSSISVLIIFPLVTALVGLYFMLAAKFMSKEFSFGSGFALCAWSSLPSLLLLPLGIIQILMSSNHQLTTSELNPLSLNQLVFHYGMDNKLTTPLDMISVTGIWGVVLMVIGFQAWAKVSRATAVKVTVIPYVLLLGAWIGIVLATSKAA
jgi:hypothetical protein